MEEKALAKGLKPVSRIFIAYLCMKYKWQMGLEKN